MAARPGWKLVECAHSTGPLKRREALSTVRQRVGDAQDPTARLTGDHDAGRIDERERENRVHRRFDVTQGTLCTGQRIWQVAGIAQRSIRREALVVVTLGATASATRGHHDGPAALDEDLRDLGVFDGSREAPRIS